MSGDDPKTPTGDDWHTPLASAPLVLPDFDDDPDTEQIDPAELDDPGRYTVLESIGQVALGEVLRVHDRELQRTVAMTVLSTERFSEAGPLARFRARAQLAGQLQHPAIVPIYDLGTLPDGRIFVTMKEVSGRSFDALVRDACSAREVDAGALRRRLVRTLYQVCEAVAYAHGCSISHGALIPRRVLVGDFGQVYVLGWGVSGEGAGGATSDVRALAGMLKSLSVSNEANLPVDLTLDAICAGALSEGADGLQATAGELAAQVACWLDRPRSGPAAVH